MIREEQVVNAVAFLTHNNVKSVPLSERIAFLRDKGLTQDEIDEALKRGNLQSSSLPSTGVATGGAIGSSPGIVNSNPSSYPSSSLPPQQQQQHLVAMAQPVAPVEETPLWARILIPSTLFLSASAGFAFLYKNLVLGDRPMFDNLYPRIAGPDQPFFPQLPPIPQQQQPGQPLAPANANPNAAATAGGNGLINLPLNNGFQSPNNDQSQQGLSGGSNVIGNELAEAVKSQAEKIDELSSSLRSLVTEIRSMSQFENRYNGGGYGGDRSFQNMLIQQSNSDIKSELSTIKTLLLANSLKGSPEQQEKILQMLNTSNNSSSNDSKNLDGSDSNKSKQENKYTSELDRLMKHADEWSANPKDESESRSSSPSGKEASTTSAADEAAAKENEMLKGERESLTKMFASTDDHQQIIAACNYLLMVLNHLIKEPTVPRYRRLVVNPSFTKALKPLEGHEEFLSSIGFRKLKPISNSYDWVEDWSNNFDNWGKKVLEDTVKNLETVKSQCEGMASTTTSKPTNDQPEKASASSSSSDTQNSSSKTTTTAAPLSEFKSPFAAATGNTLKSARNNDSIPAQTSTPKQTQQPQAVPQSSGSPAPFSFAAIGKPKSVASPAISNSMHDISQESISMNAASQRNDHDDDNGEETKQIEPNSEPTYPSSFAEIVRMQQAGIRPPGIKDIPNLLSSSEPSISNAAAPPKPFEAVSNTFADSRFESNMPPFLRGGMPSSYPGDENKVTIESVDEE